jgi:hypothetical protein
MFLDASVHQKELLLFGENKIEQKSSIVVLRIYSFLAAALARVMSVAGPIPALASVSVLHLLLLVDLM